MAAWCPAKPYPLGLKLRIVIAVDYRIDQKVEDSDKNIESFKNKKLGYEWLFRNNISLLNLIYYDHKSVFSFGWRKELDYDTTEALREALEEFPFKWEIKSKDLGVITSSD